MKLLLVLTLFSTLALAEEKGPMFEETKTQVLANIEERITAVQAHKTCVQAATSHEHLKTCHQTHKEAMKKIHEGNKAERIAWKEKRKSMKK